MGDEFQIEETSEETTELAPFTLEDATFDEVNTDVCLYCNHADICAILVHVNKLSMKKYSKTIEDTFGCSIFKAEETEEI